MLSSVVVFINVDMPNTKLIFALADEPDPFDVYMHFIVKFSPSSSVRLVLGRCMMLWLTPFAASTEFVSARKTMIAITMSFMWWCNLFSSM